MARLGEGTGVVIKAGVVGGAIMAVLLAFHFRIEALQLHEAEREGARKVEDQRGADLRTEVTGMRRDVSETRADVREIRAILEHRVSAIEHPPGAIP